MFISKVSFDELLSNVWLKLIHQLTGIPHDKSRRMCYYKSPFSYSFQSTILTSVSTISKEFTTQK
jgi:hypothetical protein